MPKHDKIKLPKRVAGIKIPKVIRKGPLGEFLKSHAGQVILAEAIVATAAIFTASKADGESAVAEGLKHPVEGVERLGRAMALTTSDHSERLTQAFRTAGRAFREALHEGYANVWQDRRDIGADEAPARKKSSGRSHDTRH